MTKDLIKIKKGTILSCFKYILLLALFVYCYICVLYSYEAVLDNIIVEYIIKIVKSTKEEMLLKQDLLKTIFLYLSIYSVFGFVLNLIAYICVKKTRSRFVSVLFGLFKICTLSFFSGADYMFVKKLKDKEFIETPKKSSGKHHTSSSDNKEQQGKIIYEDDTYIVKMMPDSNGDLQPVKISKNKNQNGSNSNKKIYPKAEIKKRIPLRIFLAIIFLPFYIILPVVNVLIPIKIITGYKDKAWRFTKFRAMLKKGMCIEEVDSIMYEFQYQEGTTRHGEYVRVYKTCFDVESKKNKRDFEGVSILFDENNKVIEMNDSYQRTSWSYS